MRLRRSSSALSRGGRNRRQPSDSSAGSAPFAYRSRRSEHEVNTGRQITREPSGAEPKSLARFLMQRFGLLLLLVALVFSSVNALILSNNVRIVTLTGAGTSPFLHDKAIYQTAASQMLAGSIWNHNKVTVNTDGISRQMLERFPELSSVSVTLPLISKRPTVYIQTGQAALILAASNGSFVIDTNGKALLNADNLSERSRKGLPVVTDQSGIEASLNHQALTSGDVSFIQTVVVELAARHVSIASLILPRAASELDVHVSGQPYFVKFNLETGDARQQAGTFLATQAQLKSQHVTPSQYVDVRVDGRAYYK